MADDRSASDLPGRFRSVVARSDGKLDAGRGLDLDLDLFEGALLVSLLVDPGEDLDAARRGVAALAGRVEAKMAAGQSPHAALQAVLFTEEGWRGDDEDYDQPSNSSVARALVRRRGLPITLSILAMEVGRIAGLRLTGVGLPGHFVVGGADLPDGMYLDPFDGGALYESGGLARRLSRIFDQPVAVGPELLRPDPPRDILARALLNLRRSFERRDRWEEALETLRCAEQVEPGDRDHARERGLLLLKCGREAEALVALEEYAAAADGEDREAVEKLIEAVRRRDAGDEEPAPEKGRIFTLDEARALLPKVKEVTADAVERYGRLPDEMEDARLEVVKGWARALQELGLEIKGMWLVDFDSGAGYYCWKYPEPALNHFHSYEEGFAGRLPLN